MCNFVVTFLLVYAGICEVDAEVGCFFLVHVHQCGVHMPVQNDESVRYICYVKAILFMTYHNYMPFTIYVQWFWSHG